MVSTGLTVRILPDGDTLAAEAAAHAAGSLRQAIARTGNARIVVATGASQLAFLSRLTADREIDWRAVEMFHLDEYVGLPADHPASFRRYLRERFVEAAGITRFHFLEVEAGPDEACRRAGALLAAAPPDVAFAGIGENGHLAFNDPPADFTTGEPYIVVDLDEACRRQQVGEGWFAGLDEVPRQAVSMSIRQILKAREIIAVVPDARKAEAVRAALEGPVTPAVPASALRLHQHATLYLDEASASLLRQHSSM